jgi:hypothetical protein
VVPSEHEWGASASSSIAIAAIGAHSEADCV